MRTPASQGDTAQVNTIRGQTDKSYQMLSFHYAYTHTPFIPPHSSPSSSLILLEITPRFLQVCCAAALSVSFGYIWTHEEACGYAVQILCNPLCAGVCHALSLILSQLSAAHSLAAFYDDTVHNVV